MMIKSTYRVVGSIAAPSFVLARLGTCASDTKAHQCTITECEPIE